MARVSSRLRVTIPKAIAEKYGIRPGDDLAWIPAGRHVLVVPGGSLPVPLSTEERLRMFDAATERIAQRQASPRVPPAEGGRGWTREGLYRRGRSR